MLSVAALSLACLLQLFPRVCHISEEKDQVLGKLALGVRRISKFMACCRSDVCMWVCVYMWICAYLVLSASLGGMECAGSKQLIFTISPHFRLRRQLELLMRVMALPSVWSVMRVAIPFLSVVGLLSVRLAGASQDSGSVIPAESRPCVDCHAFEFMQRALQDLKKTAYNLDTRTETLLLRAEKRGLCDCFPAIH
uniref:NELL2-interacting cell ontogeny regulator 1 n=2 Tax=Dromaius novaehollandiae TaxID=8790 RepID=A0A8C4K3R7_DRONO